MGKLMIWKLREDWTASRGGQTAWKQFHDQFLTYGGPPIPLVRKAMIGNGGNSVRLSREKIANLEMISHFNPMPGGTYNVSLKNNQQLSVSRLQSRIFRQQYLRM